MNENFRYEALTKELLQLDWAKHKKIIEQFIGNNKYSSDCLYVNHDTVMSIIAKVNQRKKYFEYFHGLDMSEFKETALISFWYIKMKPICLKDKKVDDNNLDAINERLALYYIISNFRHVLKERKMSEKALDALPEEYINELIYSFTFRDISKEAMILLVESIAIFLGLNPYSRK